MAQLCQRGLMTLKPELALSYNIRLVPMLLHKQLHLTIPLIFPLKHFSSVSHIIKNHQRNPLVLIDSQNNTKDSTKLLHPTQV